MKSTSKFLQSYFVPFTLMIAAIMGAVKISRMLGQYIRANIAYDDTISMMTRFFVELGIILAFAIVIYLVKHLEFKKIFKGALGLVTLLLFSSVFLLSYSQASCFSCCVISFKILLLLGWAYLNQYISFESSSKNYFGINLAYNLLVLPIILLPTFYPILLQKDHQIVFVIFLVLVLIALSCDKWISKKLLESTNHDGRKNQHVSFLAMLSLSFIAFSMNGIKYLITPKVDDALKMATNSPSDYLAYMGLPTNLVMILAFGVGIAMLFIGPYLMSQKGWKFSVNLIATLTTLSLLPLLFTKQSWAVSLNQAVMSILEIAVLIPFLQIAYTSFSFKERFTLQALVVLVYAPLMMLLTRFLQGQSMIGTIVAILIGIILSLAAQVVAKNNKELA